MMALSPAGTSCRLNPSSPTGGSGPSAPVPRHHSTKPTQKISWQRKEGSWRREFVLSMACVIIGLQMGPLGGECCTLAKAKDLKLITIAEKKAMKWSEQRMCPPWRVKSREIIVPENLPRPSVDVKSDDVIKNASAMKINHRRASSKCFSM